MEDKQKFNNTLIHLVNNLTYILTTKCVVQRTVIVMFRVKNFNVVV